ncbi:MAG: hypothetical protein KA313_09555, partial [Pseudarcicella sp.]|nr:hypothetical protein [Pseudarcicella sp.]
TSENQSENIEILQNIICTDKSPWFSINFDYKNKPFIGKINKNVFDILPVIKKRNSFVPVLKGVVTNEIKSTIKVKMRLHFSVILFLLFVTTLILCSLRTDLNNGGLIILPIVYGFVIYEYLKQSKKYKIEIEKHFK